MKKTILSILLCISLSFAFAQPGSIDTSFYSGTGFVIGDFMNEGVKKLAIQPDKKILVSGTFTSYNGSNFTKLIRLNTNGTIDSTFNMGTPGFNSTIIDVRILADSTILVAGSYTQLNSTTVGNLVKLDKNGTRITSFNSGLNNNIIGGVTLIEVDPLSGNIYVAGDFSTIGATSCKGIMRLLPDGTLDNSFDVGTSFTHLTYAIAPIYSLKLQSDGKLLVGGDFDFYKGASAPKMCRLTPSGDLDATFNTMFNGIVKSFDITNDGKIIVGGDFTSAVSTPSNKIASLNPDGTLNALFNIGDGISGEVFTVKAAPNNKVLIGGSFNFYNNIAENGLIRLNSNGTKDASFVSGTGLTCTSFSSSRGYAILVQPDSNIVVGGFFHKYNDTITNHIVRIIGKGISVLSIPTLTTATPSLVTNNSAFLGGQVTNDGNSSILSQGVCWSTSPNPVITDNYASAANGAGAFNVPVYNLSDTTIYYIKAYATNSEGTGYGDQKTVTTRSNANYTCGEVTFTYNGTPTTYGTLKGKYGRCWLDRNLGANRVPIAIYDNQANGDLFQWGRQADGHQIRTSGTTDALSATTTPVTNSFIVTSVAPFDWMSTPNNNLWNGVNAVNNPCPSGWRLPTATEFTAEMTLWTAQTPDGAFESALRLHAGGVRSYLAGGIVNVGGQGAYWTSEAITSPFARMLMVENPTPQLVNAYKSMGASVRCIKDYSDNIQVIDVNKAFIVFPNPANNQLTIQLGNEENANSELYIYDNTGRLVLTQKVSTNMERIDITQIPSGIYFVKIQSINTQQVERLVIVR